MNKNNKNDNDMSLQSECILSVSGNDAVKSRSDKQSSLISSGTTNQTTPITTDSTAETVASTSNAEIPLNSQQPSERIEEDHKEIVFFMVAGEVLLDILKMEKKIVFDKEAKRRFYIGLLNTKINTKTVTTGVLFGHIWKSYNLGCCLGKILCEENIKTKDISDDSILWMWKEYALEPTEYRPFFKSTIKGIEITSSVENYYKQKEIEKFVKLHDNYNINPDIVNINKIIEIVTSFWSEYKYKIRKKVAKSRRNWKKEEEVEINNWAADNVKKKQYQQCWKSLCQKAHIDGTEKDAMENFFNGLLTEIDDIDRRAHDMLDKRNKEYTKLILFPFFATIFNAASLALSKSSALEIPYENKNAIVVFYAIKIFNFMLKHMSFIFTMTATIFTALQTMWNARRDHNDYEETWLRHQLNRSRLITEIEKLCAGVGEYHAVIESDKEKVILKTMYKFQENIIALRKQDDENFFTNMGCINYIEKDEIIREKTKFEDSEKNES